MIYIYIDEVNQGPTIAFKFKAKSGYVFIDASARIYSSWSDFLENNKLPQCQIAYTHDGLFETDKYGQVLVKFAESPACSALAKIADGADTTAGIVGVAVTIVGLAGFIIPLTAPISATCLFLSTITGLYGAGRSINTLIDRGGHEESISLDDSEARLHWLNLVTAPLTAMGSVATMTTTRITASGKVMSSTAQLLANSAIFSSFGMCSLNIINNLANLVEKEKNGELTVLDVSSFIISMAFWTNSSMNLKTANGIIKTTQREVLRGNEKGLDPKEVKQYRRMVQNTIDETQARDINNPLRRNVHDNAKCIRAMNQISDPQEYSKGSIAVSKQFRKQNKQFAKTNPKILTPAKLRLSLDGHNCMNINNQLKINPQKLCQISPEDRTTLLQATLGLINGKDQTEFLNEVRGIKFEFQRDTSMQNMAKILKVPNLQEYECNGKKIFKDLKPHERNRIIQIENTLSQTDQSFQRIAIEFAEQKGAKSVCDFSSYVEYCAADLHSQKKDVEMSNRPNNISKKTFQVNEVSSKYIDKDNKMVKSEFQSLLLNYQEDYHQAKLANDGLAKPFKTADAATYHVKKHGQAVGLTAEQYMAKIQEVVDNATTTQTSLTQEGNAHIVSYIIEDPGSKRQTQVLVIIDEETKEYTMTMYDK